MIRTPLTRWLDLRTPVIGAPMAGVSGGGSGLAWPERWPGRALVDEVSRTWHGREEELRQDAAACERVRAARRSDDLEQGPLYAGESVGLVTAERSATDVIRDLDAAAEQALRAVPTLLG